MTVLTASFIAAPVPERRRGGRSASARRSRTGRARSRSAVSPADHDRQLAGRAGATLPDTGASRMPAPRRPDGRPRRAWIVPGRTVLMSTPRRPARRPAATPSGPPYRASDRVVVGDHRDDDVGPARPPRPASRRPSRRSARRARSPGPGSGCRATTVEADGGAGARPSPSPSGRCRGSPTVGQPRSPARSRGVVQAALDGLDDPVDRRDREVLERRGRRQRDVRRRDPDDRRVEAVEALVGDDRGDLRAPAAQPRVLLDGEQPARLLDRGEDGRPCRAARASAGR